MPTREKSNDVISPVAFDFGFSGLSYFNHRYGNAFDAVTGEDANKLWLGAVHPRRDMRQAVVLLRAADFATVPGCCSSSRERTYLP